MTAFTLHSVIYLFLHTYRACYFSVILFVKAKKKCTSNLYVYDALLQTPVMSRGLEGRLIKHERVLRM